MNINPIIYPDRQPKFSKIDFTRNASDCYKIYLNAYELGSDILSKVYSIDGLHSILGRTVQSTKVLGIAGFISYAPLWVKSVKKMVKKQGMRRVNNGIKTISHTSTLLSYFNNTLLGLKMIHAGALFSRIGLDTTFQGAVNSIPFIALFNLALSPIFVITGSISCYQTNKFLSEFSKTVGQGAETPQEKFKEMFTFIETTKAHTLSKHFQVDGESLKNKIAAVKQKMESSGDFEEAENLFRLLKDKASLTLRNHAAILAADTTWLVAAALLTFSVATVAGYILSAAIVAAYIGVMVTRGVSNHSFENQLKQIFDRI